MQKLVLKWVIPLLLADQLLKIYVKLNFTIGERAEFIPGLLELQFIENEGMAFGWALPGVAGKLVLTIFRLIASVGIGIYLFKLVKEKAHVGLLRSVSLIWSGALGNIVDSTVYGRLFSHSGWGTTAELSVENGYAPWLMANVVDMFHFTLQWPDWMLFNLGGLEVFPPIWNIADASISIGVIWIVVNQKRFFQEPMQRHQRRKSRKVQIGNLSLGGDAPIRIQSMTTTDTKNVEASIKQSLSLINVGSELVRLTAPSIKDADALEHIVKGVREMGKDTPIVADIHFTPNAAIRAADFVEKVRVNPGNYADKKKFDVHEYTDESYADELIRIKEKFTPLVLKCKELGRTIRIGTNHGSLSDRITSRYGDTPLGMVESALEFLRIAEGCGFFDMVISMKSSNTLVMVQAYRLLVSRMDEEGMNYPLHLGVTEAGDGEDGRIKSAVGIGTLLEEGVGDTIRVSLTESPEAEIPVARALVERYEKRSEYELGEGQFVSQVDPFAYTKRKTTEIGKIGGKNVPVVISSLRVNGEITQANLVGAGYRYAIADDKWNIADRACDVIFSGSKVVKFSLPGTLMVLMNGEDWLSKAMGNDSLDRHYPIWHKSEWSGVTSFAKVNFIQVRRDDLSQGFLQKLATRKDVVLVLETACENAMMDLRMSVELVEKNGGEGLPVVLKRVMNQVGKEEFTLYQSTDLGGVLIDGQGDGIWVDGEGVSLSERTKLAFGILQATRTRISQTEYISCPSCGRTLFDLEETTAKIRLATGHLKGLKIGIMGCIVNGPGEMADADYGYVGTGVGKITLYKEKEVVTKNVPESEGVEALIDLIKKGGDWVELSETQS